MLKQPTKFVLPRSIVETHVQAEVIDLTGEPLTKSAITGLLDAIEEAWTPAIRPVPTMDSTLYKAGDYGDWHGLPIIAIGPKGGKIVAYDAKGKPIYTTNAKAAKMVAQKKAAHGAGAKTAMGEWLVQTLGIPSKIIGTPPNAIVRVSHASMDMLNEHFGVKATNKTPTFSTIKFSVLQPFIGQGFAPPKEGEAGFQASLAAGEDIDTEMPDLGSLKAIPAGEWAGSHGNKLYVDPKGRKWVFKSENPTIARAEEAAARIGRLILGNVIPPTKYVDINGVKGVLIGEVPGQALNQSSHSSPPAALLQKHFDEVVAHQVVDWLTSQHDGHAGNYLSDGKKLYGIDKGQAWKFFGKDGLNAHYKPNNSAQIFIPFWKAVKAGQITGDPIKAAADAIDKAEKITPEQFKAIVMPYAQEFGGFTGKDPDKWADAITKRLTSLRKDWEGFLSEQLGHPVTLPKKSADNFETMPEVEAKPGDDGEPLPKMGKAEIAMALNDMPIGTVIKYTATGGSKIELKRIGPNKWQGSKDGKDHPATTTTIQTSEALKHAFTMALAPIVYKPAAAEEPKVKAVIKDPDAPKAVPEGPKQPITEAVPGWPQTKGNVTVHHPGGAPPPGKPYPKGYPGPGYKAQVLYKGEAFTIEFEAGGPKGCLVTVFWPDGSSGTFNSPNKAGDAVFLHTKGLDVNMSATEKKTLKISYPMTKLLKLKDFQKELQQGAMSPPPAPVESFPEDVKEVPAGGQPLPDGIVTDWSLLPPSVQAKGHQQAVKATGPAYGKNPPPGTAFVVGGEIYMPIVGFTGKCIYIKFENGEPSNQNWYPNELKITLPPDVLATIVAATDVSAQATATPQMDVGGPPEVELPPTAKTPPGPQTKEGFTAPTVITAMKKDEVAGKKIGVKLFINKSADGSDVFSAAFFDTEGNFQTKDGKSVSSVTKWAWAQLKGYDSPKDYEAATKKKVPGVNWGFWNLKGKPEPQENFETMPEPQDAPGVSEPAPVAEAIAGAVGGEWQTTGVPPSVEPAAAVIDSSAFITNPLGIDTAKINAIITSPNVLTPETLKSLPDGHLFHVQGTGFEKVYRKKGSVWEHTTYMPGSGWSEPGGAFSGVLSSDLLAHLEDGETISSASPLTLTDATPVAAPKPGVAEVKEALEVGQAGSTITYLLGDTEQPITITKNAKGNWLVTEYPAKDMIGYNAESILEGLAEGEHTIADVSVVTGAPEPGGASDQNPNVAWLEGKPKGTKLVVEDSATGMEFEYERGDYNWYMTSIKLVDGKVIEGKHGIKPNNELLEQIKLSNGAYQFTNVTDLLPDGTIIPNWESMPPTMPSGAKIIGKWSDGGSLFTSVFTKVGGGWTHETFVDGKSTGAPAPATDDLVESLVDDNGEDITPPHYFGMGTSQEAAIAATPNPSEAGKVEVSAAASDLLIKHPLLKKYAGKMKFKQSKKTGHMNFVITGSGAAGVAALQEALQDLGMEAAFPSHPKISYGGAWATFSNDELTKNLTVKWDADDAAALDPETPAPKPKVKKPKDAKLQAIADAEFQKQLEQAKKVAEWSKGHPLPSGKVVEALALFQEAMSSGLEGQVYAVEGGPGKLMLGSPENMAALQKDLAGLKIPTTEVETPLGTFLEMDADAFTKKLTDFMGMPDVVGTDGKKYPHGTTFKTTTTTKTVKEWLTPQVAKWKPHKGKDDWEVFKISGANDQQVLAAQTLIDQYIPQALQKDHGMGPPVKGASYTIASFPKELLAKEYTETATSVKKLGEKPKPFKWRHTPGVGGSQEVNALATNNRAELSAIKSLNIRNQMGHTIRMGTALKDMQVKVRKVVMPDGQRMYEISGKLNKYPTKGSLSDVTHTEYSGFGAHAPGLPEGLKTGEFDDDGFQKTYDGFGKWSLKGKGHEFDNGTTVAVFKKGEAQYASDYGAFKTGSFDKRFIARIPEGADVEDELANCFAQMGVNVDKAMGVDAHDETIFKKREVLRHLNSLKGIEMALPETEAGLDKLLAAFPQADELVADAEIRVGLAGHQHVVFPSRKVPEHVAYVGATVNWKVAVVNMIEQHMGIGSGYASQTLRWLNGKHLGNLTSAYQDEMVGGAYGAFSTVHASKSGYQKSTNSGWGGSVQWVMHPRVLKRADWYAHHGDGYGKTFGQSGSPTNVDINQQGNMQETLWPNGIPFEDIAGFNVDDESTRKMMLKHLKEAGVKELNGIPVEQFIQAHPSGSPAKTLADNFAVQKEL